MSRLKWSVTLEGLSPQMTLADTEVNRVFGIHGYEAWITSGSDSTHRVDSWHYRGRALDYRIWHVEEEDLVEIVYTLKRNLSPLFDVVLEVDHLHIEYDPP